MKAAVLPEKLKGEWIWHSGSNETDTKIFARREFTLESSVPYAELWISAIPSYHLFVNGEHVGFGPAPATCNKTYADNYDISPYLQPGNNTIGIIASDAAIPVYSRFHHAPGIWCQLNIDNAPVLWTNESWRLYRAVCYEGGQPRCHAGIEFVEKINFDTYPHGWNLNGFNDRHWERPVQKGISSHGCPVITPYGCPKCSISESEQLNTVAAGTFKAAIESTHVSFSSIQSFERGTYASQSFVYSDHEFKTEISIASDDPFVLFCNDAQVYSRGVTSYLCECKLGGRLRFTALGESPVVTTFVTFKEGWNRILMVQQCDPGSMGFMMHFPALDINSLCFRREADKKGTAGWKIAGPLKMPLEMATASLRLERLVCFSFNSTADNINDVSTWLNFCRFSRHKSSDRKEHGLKAGEYIIYELPSIQYGFPVLDITGSSSDVVDVTCGVQMVDSKVVSIGKLGRKTDTLNLGAGSNHWMKLDPRGMKYIMLTVRRASASVIPVMKFASFTLDVADESEFSCSDPVFNSIWSEAVFSLRQTTNLSFIDNPCGRRCQSLTESYIESLAAYAVFGNTSLAEKAIGEFADCQLENGSMPQMAPSGINTYSPDTLLLWPLWLEAHWEASGNGGFRDNMLPHLDMLLDFFKTNAMNHGGMLLVENSGNSAFLNEGGELDERGFFTALNALYCRALLSSARIYTDSGCPEKAKECVTIAGKVADQIRTLVLDKEKGLFSDCFPDSRSSEKYSLQTNILALYSGVAPSGSFDKIVDFFFNSKTELKPIFNTAFGIFILETLFAFGRQELALGMIKESYQNYHQGAESDCAGVNINPLLSAVIPANFLVRELLGVRTAVPGMSQIYFNPAYKLVNNAKGRILTPYGRINVEWRKNEKSEMEVSIDANYPLDVLPMLPPDVLESCVFSLGPNVNMLDPESGDK